MKLLDVHLGEREIDPTKIKVLICDIDGTVADGSHRQHFVESHPKNWKAYQSLSHLDGPIEPIIKVVNDLFWSGTKVILCSGRGSQEREVTKRWLWNAGLLHHDLYMREEGDYRADDIIKRELLSKIIEDYGKPDLILDDRDRVVKMWREEGLDCIQVAEGDF